mmetsp:Transcript_3326/g.6106  ORF Transcript_3326/g.6106 Transcript_3326/m.6106 type:complete len:520 (-) Transcript_3326:291-1850(-)
MGRLSALVLALMASTGLSFLTAPRPTSSRVLRMAVSPPPTTTKVASKTRGREWAPGSWRNFRCEQLPEYPDPVAEKEAELKLAKSAPLVFAGEMRQLQARLAEAQQGNGFLLMGGDCAESFDEFSTDHIRDTMRVILQMALTITYGSGMPVIKIGRMAGQFAKPRSSPVETKTMADGTELSLPSYKGDNVNSPAFTLEARTPNPDLMVKAYHQCAQTLNILRAFTKGGYADMNRLHAWNLDFVESTEEGSKYRELASKVDEALRFMKAIGVDTSSDSFSKTEFYTAHECLLLGYEEALTRQDSTTGQWYDCSAHMLWVGERTRQLDCGHLEFVRGIHNPIGVKISDKCGDDELVELLEAVNPGNLPGRVTLVVRMGATKVREHLPRLVKAVEAAGKHVLWITDPVHGNTITSSDGLYKTRAVSAILDEVAGFFEVHRALGTHAGGVHLEMTGESVTECLGGTIDEVTEGRLGEVYTTHCDPRLNAEQALEVAFTIAETYRNEKGMSALCKGMADEECTW